MVGGWLRRVGRARGGDALALWVDGICVIGGATNAVLALRQSVRARGGRGTALFAVAGVGLPVFAEWYAVNVDGGLRHHSRPQVRGVPLGAALGWWAITSAAQSLVDGALAGAGVRAAVRRWCVPVGTALVATSLDLALDPLGLALGLWEWRDGGPYAREVVGKNGRAGIPVANYVAWLAISGGVAAIYGVLARGRMLPDADPGATREAALVLLPYYLPPVLWALWRRRPGYLLYSGLVPVVMGVAWWGGVLGGDGDAPPIG